MALVGAVHETPFRTFVFAVFFTTNYSCAALILTVRDCKRNFKFSKLLIEICDLSCQHKQTTLMYLQQHAYTIAYAGTVATNEVRCEIELAETGVED